MKKDVHHQDGFLEKVFFACLIFLLGSTVEIKTALAIVIAIFAIGIVIAIIAAIIVFVYTIIESRKNKKD